MAKIPYVFKAIPDEFLTDEFLEDLILMKMVREIYSRIRPNSHLEEFDCNSRIHKVLLPENHFIFGRKAWAKKLNTDEETIKRKMNKLYKLNFVERYPEKTTSSSTSSFTQRSTSSSELFSTSSYSICRLCVERFKQQKKESDNQQLEDKNNQQFNQQFYPKINHKEEALASSPIGSNLCAEEQQQQQEEEKRAVVVSIEEGWKYLNDASSSVCYVMLTPKELIQNLRNHRLSTQQSHILSDDDIISLRDSFYVEWIDSALQYVNHPDTKIKKTVMHALTWHCQKSEKGKTPKLTTRKKSGKELMQTLFKDGQKFFENTPLEVSVFYDDFVVRFVTHGAAQPSMNYNSDGFENWIYAKIDHYKLPIKYKKTIQKAA